MIPPLSGSYIDETYIRLVQVSGSEFADGLGNPISFGPGSLSGGINGYIPVWNGSTSLSNSIISQTNNLLNVSGSLNVTDGITASLEGTASWAYNVVNIPTIDTSSFITNSQTSSFVTNSQTSSFITNSQTSSFVINSQTSSFVTNLQTSSFVTNVQTGSFITNNQTSSFITNSQTSSFVINSQTGSFVKNSQTSSFITNSQTSSMSVRTATTASYSTTLGADLIQPAGSSTIRLINSSGYQIGNTITINNVAYAGYADSAGSATTANNINNYFTASIESINSGSEWLDKYGNSSDYAYVVRAIELEKSKHNTINLFNYINFT